MRVEKLKIENFQCIKSADLDLKGHTLLVGQNNVGKSTICDALDLALGPDRQSRKPVVDEFDFYNAQYLDANGEPVLIRIEVLLTDVTPTIERMCRDHLERWHPKERRVLAAGELDQVDGAGMSWCLRLVTIARYNQDDDEFEADTYFAKDFDPSAEDARPCSRTIRRTFGFLYLRTLRTGSRALSLERGTLLDVILRLQSLHTGMWEGIRSRLKDRTPPIDQSAASIKQVLQAIESRLSEYMPVHSPGNATRLFASQLTREHLRETLSFFLALTPDQQPVPFQRAGTGTLNTLVLALLSFIAELKEENVIFAMEEPEIALPPHIQRRVADYLLTKTSQCLVTSHSPYVVECFEPEQILVLRRDARGTVTAKNVSLGTAIKAKTFHRHLRRGIAEAMLGNGVIVVEGMTEQLALQAVASVMEKADSGLFPLDVAGVTIFNADGDGSVAEFGRFFASLNLPVFALLDQKVRPSAETAALQAAGFKELKETGFAGAEALLAAEVPVTRLWAYLESLRGAVVQQIPVVQPSDATVRVILIEILKAGKGAGRAADLIFSCDASEVPTTLKTFLATVYSQFPRPTPAPLATDEAGAGV
jgi:putative ATP-dependent endonuclease of OLD family